jgi:class 3 adenylate cyclase
MGRTLSKRLSSAARTAFVGRAAELRTIDNVLRSPEPPFAVLFVHGPGGTGKSALARAAVDAAPDGCFSASLDCREIEPTQQGVLDALASRLGCAAAVEPIAEALGAHARALMVFDTYEVFGLLDAWLRRTFLPALPDTVVSMLLSREPPRPAWATDPGWHDLFREMALGELPSDEALALLRARGLTEEQASRAYGFTHGHALALELAAAAIRARPDLDVEQAAMPRVLAVLTRTVLDGLEPDAVEALEASSLVRRVTEGQLAAMLAQPAARGRLDRLRELPFVSARRDGLFVHDVVRDAVAFDLEQRDPARHAMYRFRAWRYYSEQSYRTTNAGLWECTADLLYLVRNPNVRNAFFPPGASDIAIEPATPADGAAIRAICERHETPRAAAALTAWWEHRPETFMVARSPDDPVAGFFVIAEPAHVDGWLRERDPVVTAWLDDLERRPAKAHERVLLLRRWLDRDVGEAQCPVQAACWLDIKRWYMALRPHLRRIYCPVVDLASYAPAVTPLGFRPVEDAAVEIDGVTMHTAALDFGDGSIDGWLSGLIGAEIAVAQGGAEAVASQRARAEPEVRYAVTSDGVSIGYWALGDGPAVVDMGQPPYTHIGLEWQIEEIRRWYERFARGHKFVRLDTRGTGLSEREVDAYTLDGIVRDLEAVVDALALPRFTLLGAINTGAAAIAYAAAHPKRVERLILWCPYSRGPEFFDDSGTLALRETLDRDWGMFTESATRSRYGWEHGNHAGTMAHLMREAISPRVMALLMDTLRDTDVTDLLPRVQAPTLIMQREKRGVDVARRIAARMADASVVVFDGVNAAMYLDDADRVWATLTSFLGDGAEGAGTAAPPPAARRGGTAVILFVDIVDSTALTEKLGDSAFREAARSLDEQLRAAIGRCGGSAIDGKLVGDGVMAVFPSAAAAIDAAVRCRALSLDDALQLHVGVHAGDVLHEGNNVYGGAVNIAARICGLSAPGEVLVSDIVRGLARTSAGVTFEDRGEHEMKGVSECVRVYAVHAAG